MASSPYLAGLLVSIVGMTTMVWLAAATMHNVQQNFDRAKLFARNSNLPVSTVHGLHPALFSAHAFSIAVRTAKERHSSLTVKQHTGRPIQHTQHPASLLTARHTSRRVRLAPSQPPTLRAHSTHAALTPCRVLQAQVCPAKVMNQSTH
jgi:hypothetical protein